MANTKKTSIPDNVRTLKVYVKTVCNQSYYYRPAVYFPEIRLVGKWLQECGFHAGLYIEVKQEHNKLTITPAWFEPEG